MLNQRKDQRMDDVKKRVDEITEQLEQGLKELFESKKYMEYLDTMSKFHEYSPNNILLIFMQKPDARLVHGYKAWKSDFGRQVMGGEHAIKIFAPAPYKKTVARAKLDHDGNQVLDENGNQVMEKTEIKIPAFKLVNVFDVSQTTGRELPQIGTDELRGNVNNYDILFEALKNSIPIPIEYEKMDPNKKGYCTREKIALQEGISQTQGIKTAIHEMAHYKLHFADGNRQTRESKEVEAESVAYTICKHLGIDTEEYSFGYIAGWSTGKEMPELKASLGVIQKTASEMITEIDNNFKELANERNIQYKNASEQGFVYRVRHNPYNNNKEESYFLQTYLTQKDGPAKLGDILYMGSPEKCRELMGKLLAGELTQQQVKEMGKGDLEAKENVVKLGQAFLAGKENGDKSTVDGKASVIRNLNEKKKLLIGSTCQQQGREHPREETR